MNCTKIPLYYEKSSSDCNQYLSAWLNLVPFVLNWTQVTICLHLGLSLVTYCALPHVRPIAFRSVVTVRRQVVLGRLFVRLPVGVHLKAVLGIRFWSILRTCPSHRKRRHLIFSTTLWLLVFLYSSSFEMFSGQKLFPRDPLWKKASILFISPCTTRQHSEPYRRTNLTLLLYSLTLASFSGYTALTSRSAEVLQMHCGFSEPCSDILLYCTGEGV